MDHVLTSEFLAATAGALLTLAFAYIPGLNTRFAALQPEVKRLIMLALLTLVAGVSYAGGCWGWWTSGLTCDRAGVLGMAEAWLAAIVSNQGLFVVLPQTRAVRLASLQARATAYDRLVSSTYDTSVS